MEKKIKIGFIGAGNMAQAIMKGILGSGMKSRVEICASDANAETADRAKKAFKIKLCADNAVLAENSDLIVIAVKPQSIQEALTPLRGLVKKDKLVISIAAGISIQKIQGYLGAVPVVRVMPNTPALVGEGACGYAASSQVKKPAFKLAQDVLNTFCKVIYDFPEDQIDAVTALSGSGPAYFFYYAEAMMQAAGELGFDKEKAKKLAAQTMIGAGRLMLESTDTAEQLRIKVTSKGGTTQAALDVMDAAGMKKTIVKAVKAAHARSAELGK